MRNKDSAGYRGTLHDSPNRCCVLSFICAVNIAQKYYENTNGEKVRALLAGYTFIGFALLCFQTVTSCPLRGLFSIG